MQMGVCEALHMPMCSDIPAVQAPQSVALAIAQEMALRTMVGMQGAPPLGSTSDMDAIAAFLLELNPM